VLLAYVLHALHRRKPITRILAIPAARAGALVLGVALNQWVRMLAVIVAQLVYTVAAWVIYLRAARANGNRWLAPPVLAVLIAVSSLHLVQFASLAGLGSPMVIVQSRLILTATWAVVAFGFALFSSPLLRTLAPALVPGADAADHGLFARIEQAMRGQRPWTDPDLDVGALAKLLGTNANAVSRALSRAGNTSFYDYVNAFRVREAERLLLDPQEARIKIEALGRQAGFRARSTFFKAFRAYAGLSPAEFRRARNATVAD
jgi:AraC-like DNA-binding protein